MKLDYIMGALTVCLIVPLCASCVVSGYGPPGTPPEVPLPVTAATEESTKNSPDDGPTQISASHVLIAYKGATRAAPYIDRTKDQALILALEIQEKAASGADFAELAKQHSDDPGSAANGGSLGEFDRSQMVQEFSEAAFVLPIGGISDVVESPFGFHVIRRDE